jgi:hypothetical protein
MPCVDPPKARATETVFRTPNEHCPACIDKRRHNEVEIATYHPYSGHGFAPETGWTHPDLP